MSLYQPFYNGKIGVVDLTLQSAYTVDLSWRCAPGAYRRRGNERLAALRIRKRQHRFRDGAV